jgi:hypothetical protein
VVIGSIAALLGAAMLAGGGAILWADQTQRDDGYLTSPRERFESSSYAIVSEPIDLVSSDPDVADWFLSDDVLGEVRLTVTGQTSSWALDGATTSTRITRSSIHRGTGAFPGAAVDAVALTLFRAGRRLEMRSAVTARS